jgi:outer membrane lipoprotein-sorting protein
MTERGIRFFLFLLCIVPLAGCAAIAPSFVQKPFSDAQVETILSGIQKQHEKVSSFYRMGRVLAKKGLWEQEAHVLIAGTKAPFRIKVELTHPWGQPIAHILVLGNRLEVLSYGEKTIYVSSLPTKVLSRFFPGPMNDDLLWAACRGYPVLPRQGRFASLKARQIGVFDEKGHLIETLHFSEGLQPEKMSFQEAGVSVLFSDFREEEGIRYAQRVKMRHEEDGKNVTLDSAKVVFNKDIPNQIFVLEKPPGFKTVYLD